MDVDEIEENEFNLNIPRYLDTFEPEEPIEVRIVIRELEEASKQERQAEERLYLLLQSVGYKA